MFGRGLERSVCNHVGSFSLVADEARAIVADEKALGMDGYPLSITV